jgi:uncharacterized protein (DUF433 family)
MDKIQMGFSSVIDVVIIAIRNDRCEAAILLLEELKPQFDAVIERALQAEAEVERLSSKVVLLERDIDVGAGNAELLEAEIAQSRERAEWAQRERNAILAYAVKLQAQLWTGDNQDRSYDARALVAVREKAGLDAASAGEPTLKTAEAIDPRWSERLVFDFNVSEDSPVVKGTWCTVKNVISLIADGWTWSDVLRTHPELTDDDIRTCLAYTVAEENGDIGDAASAGAEAPP